MKTKNVNKEIDVFVSLRKYGIEKVIFNVKEECIVVEELEDQDGEKEISWIEKDAIDETICHVSRGFKNKKGQSFYEGRSEINLPFSKIADCLKLFLGYFSDMKAE